MHLPRINLHQHLRIALTRVKVGWLVIGVEHHNGDAQEAADDRHGLGGGFSSSATAVSLAPAGR